MVDIVNELRKVINKAGKKYLLFNGHDVLYLPSSSGVKYLYYKM